MDLEEIARLIEIIDRADIEEFELEREGVRVRVRKGQVHVASTATPAVVPAVQSAPLVQALGAAEPPTTSPEDEDLHIFRAPIVGTVYITPKPDAEPFVRLGDQISAGANLCIIEAMKIFNTIESDVAGEVARILVENGQPVEFGEALFAIRIQS